jgi:3-hydroxyisobutyrate dehydrogenase-like beta-hydroxyacid dehydrogenase
VTVVGVVGIGSMGSRIARRLLDHGYELVVWNRTEEKTEPLAADGATVAASPAEAAAKAEALITMVTDPAALQAVTDGPSRVAAGAHDTLTVIDMSTVGPEAAERLASLLPDRTALLEAPVLGSIGEAESGSLTIFLGGAKEVADRWSPLLSILGRPLYVGARGAGAAAKLVANATLVGVLAVLGETISVGRALGLSDDVLFDVLAATPLAEQAARRRPAVETGQYAPRFTLSLARKDADLIVDAAANRQVDVRVLAAARTWFADAEAAGLGARDYAAVLAQILDREP